MTRSVARDGAAGPAPSERDTTDPPEPREPAEAEVEDAPRADDPAADATADDTMAASDDAAAGPDRVVDAELYGSPRRRLLLSLFIVAVLVSIVSVVMPDSVLKNGAQTVTRPFVLLTGIDQRWGVFAPNPRPETSYILARVQMADGTTDDVGLSNAAGIAEYWDYRWRKYGEQMWMDKNSAQSRVAFALWAVNQERHLGRQPVRVTLLRHTANNLPPGPGPDTGPWHDVSFFSANVGSSS